MEEPDKDIKSQPDLPEAIFPGTGNGAFFSKDDHDRILRSVDPTISLDDLLFGQEPPAFFEAETEGKKEVDASVDNRPVSSSPPSGKTRKLKGSKRPHKEEEELFPESPPPALISPEKEEGPGIVEGKRVKKVLKRIKDEESKDSSRDKQAGLSPFTAWLKGLRGSEYVHPYEDDYGLNHKSGPQGDGISETFAELLVSQGYKEQAIDMYRQLMAKFPEKSSFFAAKIEALQ